MRLVRAAEVEAEERRGAEVLFFLVFAAGVGGGTKRASPTAELGEPPHPLTPQGAPWRRCGTGAGGVNPLGESVQYS